MSRLYTVLCVSMLLGACNLSEGDRCNPLLFNDECTSSGLMCVYPSNCGVAFCCPPPDKITSRTNPNCLACPGQDALMSIEDLSTTD